MRAANFSLLFRVQRQRRLSLPCLAVCVAVLLPGIARAQVTINSTSGYTIGWNNNQYWNSTVPTNLASASGTANAFASGEFGPPHLTSYVNDGSYGNSSTWISAQSGTANYIGVQFSQANDVTSFAWSRDNSTAGTFVDDRSAGNYIVQFTTVASPGTATLDSDWTSVGTVSIGNTAGSFASGARHEFTITDSSGRPINGATGLRIFTGSQVWIALDELQVFRQVYRTNGSGSLFGTGTYSTAASGGTTTTPYVGDILAISASTAATQAITLGGASSTVRALRFATPDAVNLTAGGANSALTLGYVADVATGTDARGYGNLETTGGTTLTLDAGAGAVTIGSAADGEQVAIALNANNTWVNNSSAALTVNNGIARFSTDGTSRTLTIAGSGNTTINGAIANGGTAGTLGLTKSGAGTLTLINANTYTGVTTIASGTLQVGAGGTTGAIVGNVVNNGVLVLNRSDAVGLPGTLSGTGAVIQSGAGTVVFTGSSSFTGDVSVAAGTVLVRNAGSLGIGNVSIAANGRLDVNASGATVGNDLVLGGGTVASFVVATGQGGTYSTTPDGLYGLNTFTSGSGTFSGYVGSADVLVVGGGGGGGSRFGGGGGAGGVIYQQGAAVASAVAITVGEGGSGGAATDGAGTAGAGFGISGQNSVFGDLIAFGGGGGAAGDTGNGLAGGSGGGAAGRFPGTGGGSTSGQGFSGGDSTGFDPHVGGGGGGAGGAGSVSVSVNGVVSSANGAGGVGQLISITGSNAYYGGGGGGGTSFYGDQAGGSGGLGGGGTGGSYTGSPAAIAGLANTGGGGGGGAFLGYGNQPGAGGGSGIVVVRYELSSISNNVQTLAGGVTLNATSTLDAVRGSGGLRFTGAMSGAGGLTIASTGSGATAKVIFDGAAKSYAGPTAVNSGGDLRVNSDNSLATGAVTVNGRLGGSGSLGGSVTISSGGVLAPGNSIESLTVGALSFAAGSTYEYEIDSSVVLGVGADLTKALGNLSLAGTVNLSLVDLATSPTAFADGTTFSLVNYTGSWNNGLFTVGGSQIVNGGSFTVGLNTWQVNYAATSGGSNFTGDHATGAFVNIVAVPEPGAMALASIGVAAVALALRRRT